MKYHFTYYTDPGHGWLEVTQDLINTLNITNDISSCSYKKDKIVYLEEDLDAGLFLNKLKENQKEFSISTKTSNTDSFIRNLKRYGEI